MVNCTPVPLPAIPGMPRTSLPGGAPPLSERSPNIAPAAGAKRGTKRKSTDAPPPEDPDAVKAMMFPDELDEIEDDDPRLEQYPRQTCNQVRRQIRTWTESGAQKIGEFQRTIGVSGPAYGRFMNRTGTWAGEETDTYWKAQVYFNKRRLLGLPLALPKPKKAKKAKTAAAAASGGADPAAAKKAADQDAKMAKLLDTCDDITLPGEGTEAGVPVFDTPAEMRKKFRALLAKEGVTKSAFMRALSKMIPDDTPVSAQNLKTFMDQTGTMDGNTSKSFYAGYLLFEKQRIRDGKPKSAFRQEMEARHWPEGVNRTTNMKTTGFICLATERPYIDKYGSLEIM
ncbi:hypothetical protein RB595_006310 [Gaeumannomyces hyphopodioides]